MNNYKAALVAVTVVCALAFTTVNLWGQGSDGPSTEKKLTGKQKEHSKLYKQFEGKNKKIKELLATGKDDIKIGIIAEGEVDTQYSTAFNLSSFIENSVCAADAVIVGSVNSKDSQLTEAGGFIFTDYEITVEEVLKDNPSSSIPCNSRIVVTRAGGEMLLNGRKVTAISEYLEPLAVGGRYLLFLNFIPATSDYQALNSRGSFQLHNNKLVPLTKEQLPAELKTRDDAVSFINRIRTASASTCGGRN